MAAQWIAASRLVDTADTDDHDRAGWEALIRAVNVPSWHADAACREHNASLWFPTPELPTTRLAVEVCRSCLTREECAAWALENDGAGKPHGIYGGLTPNQRTALRRLVA